MKTLKAICTAAVLALALSVPAYAGDISSPGLTSSGDVGSPSATAPAPGDVDTSGTASTELCEINTDFMAILLVLAAVL